MNVGGGSMLMRLSMPSTIDSGVAACRGWALYIQSFWFVDWFGVGEDMANWYIGLAFT